MCWRPSAWSVVSQVPSAATGMQPNNVYRRFVMMALLRRAYAHSRAQGPLSDRCLGFRLRTTHGEVQQPMGPPRWTSKTGLCRPSPHAVCQALVSCTVLRSIDYPLLYLLDVYCKLWHAAWRGTTCGEYQYVDGSGWLTPSETQEGETSIVCSCARSVCVADLLWHSLLPGTPTNAARAAHDQLTAGAR